MESANVVSENANVVRIMSIHKSKGLEFPVCIIAGCGRKFVNDTDDLRMHPQLGVGMRLTDPETGVRRTAFIREAIGLATAESASAEELRVFYVAMTRAKEKLILLSTVKNIDTNLQKLAAQITEEETVPPYTVSNASGISEWLMLCALRHPNGTVNRRFYPTCRKPKRPHRSMKRSRRASKGIFRSCIPTPHRQSLQRRSRPPRFRQNKPKRKPHFHARRF